MWRRWHRLAGHHRRRRLIRRRPATCINKSCGGYTGTPSMFYQNQNNSRDRESITMYPDNPAILCPVPVFQPLCDIRPLVFNRNHINFLLC
jgi:hypothetical protein